MHTACVVLLTLFAINCNAYHIDVSNAQSYQEGAPDGKAFKYGYQVEKVNDQFQHKQQGPDAVTYGCYGYTDLDGRRQLTYFVADRLGYRTLVVNQAITVYPNTDAGNKLLQWNDLPFPVACLDDKTSSHSSVTSTDDRYPAESQNNYQYSLQDSANSHSNTEVAADLAGNDGAHSSQQDANSFDEKDPAESHKNYQYSLLDDEESHSNVEDTSSAGNESTTADDTHSSQQDANASNISSSSTAWKPFTSTLQGQCGQDDPDGQRTLTLYVPFRIACSDMEAFETELNQFIAKFNRPQC